MVILWVALAGGVGAVIRWLVSAWFAERAPRGTGTTLVNLVGALGLGAVVALSHNGQLHPDVAVVIGTGLLGALTTFSTWMVETLEGSERAMAGIWWRTVPHVLMGMGLVMVGTHLGGGVN
ncbi:MAG: CrcB family protein [bacterium]|nr:CrcB family protein [bacterium]